jgi:hypothetical protein
LVLSGSATVWKDGGDLRASVGIGGGVEITAGTRPGEVVVRGLSWRGLIASSGGDPATSLSSTGASSQQSVTLEGVSGDFNIELDQQAEVVLTNIQIPGRLHIAGSWYGSTPERDYVVHLDNVRVHDELEIAAETQTWDGKLGFIDQSSYREYSYAEVHLLNSDIGDHFKVEFARANVEVNNSHIGGDLNVNTNSSGNTVHIVGSHLSSGMGLDLRNGDFDVNEAQITGSTFDDDVDVNLFHRIDDITIQGSTFHDDLELNGDGSTSFWNEGGNHFDSLDLNGGIVELYRGVLTLTQGYPVQPAPTLPGPRVIQSTPFPDHLRVTFDKPVAVNSFTPDQVAVTNQAGQRTTVQRIQVVPNSLDHSFDIFFQPFASGGYQAVLGPNITDTSGHAMDQNQNGVNGENPGDLCTIGNFTKPQVQSAVPSYGHIRVTFNELIDPATVTAGSVTLTDTQGKRVPVLSVHPAQWTAGYQFDIEVAAFPRDGYNLTIAPTARDAFGNRMAGAYTTKYLDKTPPRVVGLTDPRVGIGITVTFSEPIDVSRFTAAAVTITLRTGQRIPVREILEISDSDSRSFDIRFQADPGDYHLTLDTTVADVFGNRLASPYKADFSLRLTAHSTLTSLGLAGNDLLALLGGVLPYHIDPTDPAARAMLQTLTQRVSNLIPSATPSQLADQVASLFSADPTKSPLSLATSSTLSDTRASALPLASRTPLGGV